MLRAILISLGAREDQIPGIFGVVDKIERQPRDISREKLAATGFAAAAIESLLSLMGDLSLSDIEHHFAASPDVMALVEEFRRYFDCLDGLGVLDWVTIDLKIVRGLAYYTGIVFELFDAKGELRAICGGGRYDTLLQSLGGVDLPALGFGMGDVVLAELLRDRGLMPTKTEGPQVWVASENSDRERDVRRAATALRRGGVSVEYALRHQQIMKQVKAAKSAGASWVLTLHGPANAGGTRTWSPDPPPEWDRLVADIGL